MDRGTYLQITEEYEKLCSILDQISELGRQAENSWKTEAGKLFILSFDEAQLYIRKILAQFGSELNMTGTDSDDTSEGLGEFNF